MRRNEHELTDQERIDTLIGSCQVCRLGFVDGDRPYIVPLNFGYAREGGRRIFYFHGAREGRKMDLARRNGTAGFELDTAHELHEGDAACSYSFRYQSVIGSGTGADGPRREAAGPDLHHGALYRKDGLGVPGRSSGPDGGARPHRGRACRQGAGVGPWR